jgi:hypothetical protein
LAPRLSAVTVQAEGATAKFASVPLAMAVLPSRDGLVVVVGDRK